MAFTKYLLVGLLFFFSLAVVGYFTIVTEGGPLHRETESMTIFFDNADGIKIGNPVTVSGVPFGYVSEVQLVQIGPNGEVLPKGQVGIGTKVRVRAVLDDKLRLYENYKIQIKNQSLISGRVIAIDPGTAEPRPEESAAGKTTYNQPLDYEAQTVQLRGETLKDPLVSLSELIAENRSDIRKTVSNLASISEKVNQGNGTIGKLINDDALHSNVNTVLSDAKIVLREVREGIEDTREQAPVTSFIRAALSSF